MKTLYTFIFLLFISVGASAQPYYVYTATKTGVWNDATVWSIGVRTDGVLKSKVIIPAAYIISVDNAVNSFGLGDVEINIYGNLAVQPSTTIVLSAVSTIQLYGTGKISGTSNTQKISIGGVNKYVGNIDLTKTGASIANASTGVSPSGFTTLSALPVKLTSFTVAKNAGAVLLKWSTALEISNDHFEIERSYDGSTWATLSTVKGAGASNMNVNYSYTDNSVAGKTIYYRLKQVDIDGGFEYSAVRTIRDRNTAAAKIYSTANAINIELNTEIKSSVLVTVMNTNGQVIAKKQFATGYKINLDLATQQSGVVFVNVADNNGLNQTTKLLF
jgi:hypothetical protein